MARTKAVAVRRAQTTQLAKATGNGEIKKKRRYKSGRRALANIKKLQRSEQQYFLGREPVSRVVREMAEGVSTGGVRFAPEAIALLRAASDEFIYKTMEEGYNITTDNRRQTLTVKDYRRAVRLLYPKLF
jgi:histone H3/H4